MDSTQGGGIPAAADHRSPEGSRVGLSAAKWTTRPAPMVTRPPEWVSEVIPAITIAVSPDLGIWEDRRRYTPAVRTDLAADLQGQVDAPEWYHTIELVPGAITPGGHAVSAGPA